MLSENICNKLENLFSKDYFVVSSTVDIMFIKSVNDSYDGPNNFYKNFHKILVEWFAITLLQQLYRINFVITKVCLNDF